MPAKITRKIVHIDEDKCNGCGVCVPSCVEGALQIIDGKARLVSETYCDGLGACLGKCPQDAITVEEREAPVFDEEATERHMAKTRGKTAHATSTPAAVVNRSERKEAAPAAGQPSTLAHWPLQLALVQPAAPFLQGADVLLAGDCVPFVYGSFHRDFLKGHALLVACPKLDDFAAHQEKLTDILRKSDIKSLTVLHMEVPCCSGLTYMARQAINQSGKDTPLTEITITTRGDVKSLNPA